ncbi:MAG: hypothetical protein JWO91_3297 [Acidobacteriaceae bacterium]|nr:hypothetical protein [Acidobacteriaceae bacterium]
MSEVVPEVQHEFWRPPVTRAKAADSAPSMVVACPQCNTEFMVGSRFCYLCGSARKEANKLAGAHSQSHPLGFMRALMFQNVKQSLGLSLASMIALLVGIGCIVASILVGLVHSIQNPQDFQAVQLWRMEWLVGAVAAFVAGILLKVKVAEK